jgi:phage/plasmid-associated DNA primase
MMQKNKFNLFFDINTIINLNDEEYQIRSKIDTFFENILPIERVRHYILNILSSCILDVNKDKKLHFWTGNGSNGKSTLVNLIKNTFGDYCYIICSIKDIDKLLLQNNKHIIILDIIIKSSFILSNKILQFIKTSSCKIIFVCNELPEINIDDDIWDNISVVEFISHFCDNPFPNKKYEFLVDTNFQKQMKRWNGIFMYMLIEDYQNSYLKTGIQEPQEVIKNTVSYHNDSDIYRQFIYEYLCKDDNNCLGIDDIFPIFRRFIQYAGINLSKYTRREFENRLNRIIGKCNVRKKWKGWKISSNNEEDNDPICDE